MKIDRVILSTTSDPLYADGIKYVRKAWENMGAKVTVIQIGKLNDSRIESADMHFQSIPNIPDANFAKLIRVIMAQSFLDDYCLISDADMIPLNSDYFIENSEYACDDGILFYTKELDGDDAGKFPACYMLAKGSTFKKYVNPQQMPIQLLIQSWRFGKMENASKLPFSDESIYRRLFEKAQKKSLDRYHQDKRLCRSNWEIDYDMLENHGYIDCHMLRPFNEYKDKLKPVFQSIGIEI